MAKDSTPLSKSEKDRLVRVGKRIKQIREKKGFTLEVVEERGYPSAKHLQALEYGRKNLTITSLFRLAEALDVDPCEIIKGIK